jgi:hypothetical protein
MASRDVRPGPDPDDWFDEPELPIRRRARGNDARRRTNVEPAAAGDDDWIGDGETRPERGPRPSPLAALSEPRLAGAAAVALVVLIALGLGLSGVFSSSSPNTAGVPTAPATTASIPTQPARTVVPAPTGPLKPGDQGAQVKVLQRALASLGYATGAVDGDYGPATKQAVTKFQRASKLTADGILGPKTLAALRTALNGP